LDGHAGRYGIHGLVLYPHGLDSNRWTRTSQPTQELDRNAESKTTLRKVHH
jgi:hypothetical protein